MKNIKITKQALFITIVLLVLPLVFAGNYGEGSYGSGIFGVGPTTSTSSPSSGGGGGGVECVKNLDCGENRYCFENKCNDAQCFDDSACDLESGETCWNFRCVKLFDIKIIDIESPVTPGQDFEITYFLKGLADVSDDVEIYFWIEKDGKIVSSGLDTIYVGSFEEKTETIKMFMPSDATPGIYAFFAEIRYQDYQAQTYRTIESSLGSFQLFDISFSLDDSLIQSSDELSGIVTFESFGNVPTPVDLTFTILDSRGNEVHRESESVIVETEEILRKSFKGLDLPDGKYTLILRTVYNIDVIDKFEQDFEIGKEKRGITGRVIGFAKGEGNLLWIGVIGIFVLGAFILWAKRKGWFGGFKKRRKERKVKAITPSPIREKVHPPKISVKKKAKNFLEFFKKHKIFFLISSLILILAGFVYYLFYAGILTLAQLQDLWNSIVNGIIAGYNSISKWIVVNWPYLVIGGIAIFVLGVLVWWLIKRQKEHKEKKQRKKVKVHKKSLFTKKRSIVLIRPKKKITSKSKRKPKGLLERGLDRLTKERHPKLHHEIARIKQKHKPHSQLNKQEEK